MAFALVLLAVVAMGQQPDRQIVISDVATQRFAIPDCVPRRGDEASVAACTSFTRVLKADLEFEGLFQFIPDSLIKAIPAQNPDAPNMDDWKGIGAGLLAVSRAEVANGQLAVDIRVYFVASGQVALSRRFTAAEDKIRAVAHQASDEILSSAQYKGVARSHIAFVADRDSKERKSKEIYIADYDGFNARRVTVNNSLNIVPSWSMDGRTLAYVSYRQGVPAIFLAAIYEGRATSNVTGEKGGSQAFAPSFSPDGKRLAYASNRSGNMDIWVSGADGAGPRRLTSFASGETAPCWSPTGQEIAFTSDRGGTPQIWVMDSEGLNVRRLTTVGNYNDGCAWSPSRQTSEIAYTARLDGPNFDIAVIDLATRQVRQISQGRGSCEYPAWAPNGRHLVFSCQRGRNSNWQITVADREGRELRPLAVGPGNNVQPDWGP